MGQFLSLSSCQNYMWRYLEVLHIDGSTYHRKHCTENILCTENCTENSTICIDILCRWTSIRACGHIVSNFKSIDKLGRVNRIGSCIVWSLIINCESWRLQFQVLQVKLRCNKVNIFVFIEWPYRLSKLYKSVQIQGEGNSMENASPGQDRIPPTSTQSSHQGGVEDTQSNRKPKEQRIMADTKEVHNTPQLERKKSINTGGSQITPTYSVCYPYPHDLLDYVSGDNNRHEIHWKGNAMLGITTTCTTITPHQQQHAQKYNHSPPSLWKHPKSPHHEGKQQAYTHKQMHNTHIPSGLQQTA